MYKRIIWTLGIPFDYLMAFLIALSRKWEWHRLPLHLSINGLEPEIEKFNLQTHNDGTYEADIIFKHNELLALGSAMMQMMEETEGAENYIELAAMAPNGNKYTFLITHMAAKTQATIISELKQEIAELTK